MPDGGRRRRSVGGRWYTCSVLSELRVENLLLIERAELRLGPGLNVLTGETGRGQDRARARARPAARRPRAPGDRAAGRGRGLRRGGLRAARRAARRRSATGCRADAEELVLARRVSAEGRTRAYLAGRSATVADLRDVGGRADRLLRPARAPQADARLGPARDPRRLLRRRAPGAARGVRRAVRAGARAARRRWTSCASAPAPASASSTCSSTSWTRSRRRRPTRPRRRSCSPPRSRLRHVEALGAAALGASEAVLAEADAGTGRA